MLSTLPWNLLFDGFGRMTSIRFINVLTENFLLRSEVASGRKRNRRCIHIVAFFMSSPPIKRRYHDGRSLVLLVRVGGSGRCRVLHALKKSNVTLVCVDSVQSAWAQAYIDDWIILPLTEHKHAIDAVVRYEQEYNVSFDAVYSYDDYGVAMASAIGDALRLRVIPPETVSKFRNKYRFRQECLTHGIPAPKHCLVSAMDTEQYSDILSRHDISFPVVAKPAYAAGKYGVRCIHSIDELEQHMHSLTANIDAYVDRWQISYEHASYIVIEEYIQGDLEFDLDCIVDHGNVVFCSINKNNPVSSTYFVESGGQVPAVVDRKTSDELKALLKCVVSEIGGPDLFGCFHFEAKMVNGTAVPIELNLRIGGAETYTLVKAAWDIDLARHAIQLAMQEPCFIAQEVYPKYSIASINFLPAEYQTAGKMVLKRQDIDARLYYHSGFVDLELYFEEGDVVAFPPAGSSYLGWLVARGSTTKEAQQVCSHLTNFIDFHLYPR